MGRRGAGEAGEWALSVARVFEQLIDDKGLTKQAVADSADIGLSYLYDRLRGKHSLTLNDVEKLAGVLGIHPTVALMLTVKEPSAAFYPGEGIPLNRVMLSERLKTLTTGTFADGSLYAWERIEAPARKTGLTESAFEDLREGVGSGPVPRPWLEFIASEWEIDSRFLTHMEDQQVLEATLAMLDLRSALRESGTDSLSARMVGEASPAAIRAIAAAIRSTSR